LNETANVILTINERWPAGVSTTKDPVRRYLVAGILGFGEQRQLDDLAEPLDPFVSGGSLGDDPIDHRCGLDVVVTPLGRKVGEAAKVSLGPV
jgi:hypothetical protein